LGLAFLTEGHVQRFVSNGQLVGVLAPMAVTQAPAAYPKGANPVKGPQAPVTIRAL
jgi:hypothetical protein